MKFNKKARKILFIILYSFIMVLLVFNTLKSKLLADIVYSSIFIILYLKYLYKLVLN